MTSLLEYVAGWRGVWGLWTPWSNGDICLSSPPSYPWKDFFSILRRFPKHPEKISWEKQNLPVDFVSFKEFPLYRTHPLVPWEWFGNQCIVKTASLSISTPLLFKVSNYNCQGWLLALPLWWPRKDSSINKVAMPLPLFIMMKTNTSFRSNARDPFPFLDLSLHSIIVCLWNVGLLWPIWNILFWFYELFGVLLQD